VGRLQPVPRGEPTHESSSYQYPRTSGRRSHGDHALSPRGGPCGLWTLLAAHLVTVWGTQWDIRWHLLIGRDSFWIPPHLMTYSGVTAIVLVSFGVLAWTSVQALRGVTAPGMIRLIGITGTRGYHLAAYGIALTVLAAPIDDLWHRTFGLDVTLWSPPPSARAGRRHPQRRGVLG